ncbi:MAG TPA: hypothetical protein DCW68_01040 [Rhodospirillaceae bacterium]|nr:MAG: hypothetical protein A2018_00575 [Alphaproteobacteria bacterium GWF2_58_20]HAU28684.1 hypothetical protein [Rhodospirillaceae bacterium]
MIQLGNTPDGECLEAAGQAKYLARFVLAAASEISQLPMVSVPEPMGDMRNVVPFRTQSA